MGTKLAPTLGGRKGDVVGEGLGTEMGPWLGRKLAPTLGGREGDVVGEGLGTELDP